MRTDCWGLLFLFAGKLIALDFRYMSMRIFQCRSTGIRFQQNLRAFFWERKFSKVCKSCLEVQLENQEIFAKDDHNDMLEVCL